MLQRTILCQLARLPVSKHRLLYVHEHLQVLMVFRCHTGQHDLPIGTERWHSVRQNELYCDMSFPRDEQQCVFLLSPSAEGSEPLC